MSYLFVMKLIENVLKQCKTKNSPLVALAPMVNHSERAFRILTNRHGISLTYSPMIHAENFARSHRFREQNFEFEECNEDKNLVVQFCGNNPDIILKAARYVENKCDAIDINFGCPQGIAKKGKYGVSIYKNIYLPL